MDLTRAATSFITGTIASLTNTTFGSD